MQEKYEKLADVGVKAVISAAVGAAVYGLSGDSVGACGAGAALFGSTTREYVIEYANHMKLHHSTERRRSFRNVPARTFDDVC